MMSSDMMLCLTVLTLIFVSLPALLYLPVQYSKCRGDTANAENNIHLSGAFGKFYPFFVDMSTCRYYLMHIQVYIKLTASVLSL